MATIIGERGFEFLPQDCGMPAVISGFEPEDILTAVYLLLKQIADGEPRIENEYKRAVAPEGNPLAQKIINECFVPRRDLWRGLGAIDASGLALRDELAEFDAEKKFAVEYGEGMPSPCRCGDVICGRIAPRECLLFGARCTPEDPVGPCMVSSEGACAAAYKYQSI